MRTKTAYGILVVFLHLLTIGQFYILLRLTDVKSLDNVVFQLFALVVCLFISKFTLKYVGLDTYQKYLEKVNK
jgi:hypothetical protein